MRMVAARVRQGELQEKKTGLGDNETDEAGGQSAVLR